MFFVQEVFYSYIATNIFQSKLWKKTFYVQKYFDDHDLILAHKYPITNQIRIFEMSHKRNRCAHQSVCQKSLIKLVYICTNAVCFVCMHSSHQINICVCITTNIFKASETYHIRIYIQYNDVMHSNELIKQILSFWRRKNLKISLECIDLFFIFLINLNSKINKGTSDVYVIKFRNIA